jgi:hypothetical protein
MTTAIDTLSYVKRLEAAGVDRRTAEAHAEAINATVLPQVATNADLNRATDRLGTRMDRLESRIEALLWKHSLAILLGVLTIGGMLVRFVR